MPLCYTQLCVFVSWAIGSSVDRDNEGETDTTVLAHAEQQYRHLTLKQQRERLPVFSLRKYQT
jgi:ATP-dependent RNA helicase DDX35